MRRRSSSCDAPDCIPDVVGDQKRAGLIEGDSYRAALLAAAAKTAKPVCGLASIPAAIDVAAADRLRAAGVPVLESTRTGLLALRHLLDHGHLLASVSSAVSAATPASSPRRTRWVTRLAAGPLSGADLFDLLRDYGIPAVQARSAASRYEAHAAASDIGYPVAVKTDAPGITHKSDVGGVWLGVTGPAELDAAYADLSARLGPQVTVTEMAAPGAELILGMSRDPALGPLIVLGAGGVLAEYLAETAVALPPLTAPAAADLIAAQRFARLLHGYRGQSPADLPAVAAAVSAFSVLITDLGDHLEAFDINPLICGTSGAIAVDALAVSRLSSSC